MPRTVQLSLGLSVLSLLVASTALVVSLSRSQPQPQPQQRVTPEADAAVRAKVDRLRSVTQARGMVIAIHSYASNHDWQAPAEERWKQELIDDGSLSPEMFDVHGGQPVAWPYHYIRPSRDELLAVTGQSAAAETRPAGQVVVIYEDPGLWNGGGGNVVYLDTSTRWIDADAYAEFIAGLSR